MLGRGTCKQSAVLSFEIKGLVREFTFEFHNFLVALVGVRPNVTPFFYLFFFFFASPLHNVHHCFKTQGRGNVSDWNKFKTHEVVSICILNRINHKIGPVTLECPKRGTLSLEMRFKRQTKLQVHLILFVFFVLFCLFYFFFVWFSDARAKKV